MSLETIGTKVDQIPVELNYHIIRLLSAGLYSSPNKAFEELVSNSYDAGATKVASFVPYDKTTTDAVLWVCDNGASMDSAGLKELWQIGTSSKRENEDELDRLPIGKFGIGKLATYVLTRQLTYVCKVKSEYRAVTMDYKTIDEAEGTRNIMLDERILTEEETKQVLKPLITADGVELLDFKLWGEDAEDTWTFAIMSDLRTKASEIQDGRLRWILRTALPLNPNFQLYFNAEKLTSTKDELEPEKTLVFGKEDEIVEKNEEYTAREQDGEYYVDLPTLKNVRGQIDYFTDTLAKEDKSSKWGRSHGIFLMVRNRLINLNDAHLGMKEMTYGVFNRMRMIIHADGLDTYITSTRENITDSAALEDLKRYITKKFTEIRKYHFAKMEELEKAGQASYKVAHAAGSLTRRPLLMAARRFFDREITQLYLTNLPDNLSKEDQAALIERLEQDLTSEEGIIKEVEWDIMGPGQPVAKFDIMTGKARINMLHPFFANFSEDVSLKMPFQLMAVAEILTEAHLVESGLDEDTIIRTMKWRDEILRELTYKERKSAPLVANIVMTCLSDPGGLEEALTESFNNLGFNATGVGGLGKPDGVASAKLGYRNIGDTEKADYSFTYDAKSTSKDKIKATHAHISGVARHRDDYKADFAVVVAIDFEGADNPDSAVNKEAKANNICLICAIDLITLLILSVPKQIGLLELKDLFENNHTVIETKAWIEKNVKNKEVAQGPIKELLETAYNLQTSDKEPPTIAAIRQLDPKLKAMGILEIRTMVQSLERFVGDYISLNGEDVVSLNQTPDKIMQSINHQMTSSQIPIQFQESFLRYFEGTKK